MMKMKILIGIVLYNPDINILKKNIDAVAEQKCKADKIVYIVDNASDNQVEIYELLEAYNDCMYFRNSKNKGIAAALNQIMNFGVKNNADWVLTLDQDSIIPFDMLSKYEEFISTCDDIRIGMVSPYVHDRNVSEKNTEKRKVVRVDKCITSGCMLKTSVWKLVGKYDEWFFIDYVDFEMCAKLKLNDYSMYRLNDVIMSHSIGEAIEHKLLGFVIKSTNHSPFRHYYYSRNLIYFAKKYGYLYPNYNYFKIWILEFICALFYEDNKQKNISAMICGVKDAYVRVKKHEVINQQT